MCGCMASSDDDLIRAAILGNDAAFATLMHRHRDWVRRLMAAFVHDTEQAEDLAQEVFCRVHTRLGDYAAQGKFTAWLKRVAANVARDHLRRRRKRGVLVPLDSLENTPTEEPGVDPAVVFASRMMREELREALTLLPDDQRQVMILHYFGDRSVEDIAAALHCPLGTVKSRLFHGRRRIREALTYPNEEGANGL